MFAPPFFLGLKGGASSPPASSSPRAYAPLTSDEIFLMESLDSPLRCLMESFDSPLTCLMESFDSQSFDSSQRVQASTAHAAIPRDVLDGLPGRPTFRSDHPPPPGHRATRPGEKQEY